jgi:hypothetical protein
MRKDALAQQGGGKPMKTLVRAFALSIAVALFASPALADKRRVVVLGFSGPAKHARQTEKTVTKSLKAKYEVVSIKKYNAARKSLKATKPTKKNFSRIARQVGLDAIVSGEVRKRGSRATLKLTVREGATGKVIDTLRVPIRSKKLAQDAVAEDLYDIVAWAEPIGDAWERALPRPDDSRRTSTKTKTARMPEPDPAAPDSAFDEEPLAPGADDDLSGDSPFELSSSVTVERETGPRAVVDAGMSFIGRSLTFSHQASLAPEQQPTSYDGSPVGGVQLRGELYPTRFLSKAPPAAKHLDRVAVSFELDNAVGLSSQYSDDTMDYDLDTTQRRWGVGLGYALPIKSASLKLAAGYNGLRHSIKTGGVDIGLPDVKYGYFDLGAAADVPIAGKLRALGHVKYLAVQSAGDIVAADAYGKAGVRGFDLDAGVAYAVTSKVHVRGGVRYLRMAFDFAGTGDMSTDLDGDPDQDVGGAADKYVGAYVLGGYSF